MNSYLLKSKGFSVVELFISTIMVSVLLSLALPSISSFAASTRLKSETKKIANALELLSVKSNYYKDDIDLTLKEGSITAYRESDSKKPVLNRVIPSGITVSFNGRKTISFYKNGTVSPASINITSKSEKCAVRLALRGRTTIECG